MAILNLTSTEKIPAGEHIATVEKVVVEPTNVTVTWVDEENRSVSFRYTGAIGNSVLSKQVNMLLPYTQGQKTFDTDELLGVRAKIEVTYKQGKNPNAKGEYPEFPNLTKIVEVLM